MNNTRKIFDCYVLPTYSRFDITLERGEGSYVWDSTGKRYLDMGAGIAVCALGHAHPEIAETIAEQSRRLIHVSNLYYNEWQGKLAQKLVELIGPGRIFFCNSGVEANEGLFKLARRFGNSSIPKENATSARSEIITAFGSFHGRTLAGIAATGQEKIKKGFDPPVAGFKHVPFNDLEAMREVITENTAAILIEPIQGESGITVASAEYLRGLRELCNERRILLLFDEVQAGHFRTGAFHSWQRGLNVDTAAGRASNEPKKRVASFTFLPDAISMAKSLGNGFPIGAFWVNEKYADLLGPGSHASTYGGTPLACAVALKVLEIIERDQLAKNATELGDFLKTELQKLHDKFPDVISEIRGSGLMIGIQFSSDAPAFNKGDDSPAVQIIKRLHERGMLAVPAAGYVVRLLPPLNLKRSEAEEAIAIIANVVHSIADQH